MKRRFLIVLPFVLLALSGCSVFSPYNSEFQCTSPDKGKCVSVQQAYEESLEKDSPVKKTVKGKKSRKADDSSVNEEKSKDLRDKKSSAEESYKESLQREMARLIDEPVTPVVIPPKVMRILVLPYPEKTVLYMPRFIYIMTDNPRWVLGDYLINKGQN